MQITYKIWKVKDVYEKVLKDVTCKLRKVSNKSVKSIKKVLQLLEFVRKSPPAENTHHAETSQPAMQIIWLAATKRKPKTRGDFRTDQITTNTCNFIIFVDMSSKLDMYLYLANFNDIPTNYKLPTANYKYIFQYMYMSRPSARSFALRGHKFFKKGQLQKGPLKQLRLEQFGHNTR